MTLSEASTRAMDFPASQYEWHCGFAYTPVAGLGPEVGVHRRDPSSVILVDGLHYVYYTRSVGPHFSRGTVGGADHKIFPWDMADIYYATSKDGMVWEEQGPAVSRGPAGTFDSRTVCTPDVLEHDGKFYLVYQTQSDQENYDSGRSERVGMAIASAPTGPWRKVEGPILERMEDGEWFGGENNYNSGVFGGVTHDPSLYFYKGEFWLYYKCGYGCEPEIGVPPHKFAGPDTRWGVATSKVPEGPYKHSDLNPVTNSGHETMLWHYNGGIAALLNRDGPEAETIQWSPDGVNFRVMAHVHDTPQAGGAFRSGLEEAHPLAGMRWGLCHVDEKAAMWNYIVRFDVDQRISYKRAFGYPESNAIGIF